AFAKERAYPLFKSNPLRLKPLSFLIKVGTTGSRALPKIIHKPGDGLQVLVTQRLSGTRVQEQLSVTAKVTEVEQPIDPCGRVIKRSLPDALLAQPVVFDEPQHRGLIGCGVVDEIFLRPRGNG